MKAVAMWGADKSAIPCFTPSAPIAVASALPSLIKGKVGRGLPLEIKLDHHMERRGPHPGI